MAKLHPKTDNYSLEEKVSLRRMVIAEADLGPLSVLDLFAGEGNIWNEMRRKSKDSAAPPPANVVRYTPVDEKAKQPGQIKAKITGRLIAALARDGGLSRYNVIEIDCYGDPWEIWRAILDNITSKTVVFITRGKVTYAAGRMSISGVVRKLLGIPEEWNLPGKIELLDHGDDAALKALCPTAHVSKAWKKDLARVDYYGLIVEPGPGPFAEPKQQLT